MIPKKLDYISKYIFKLFLNKSKDRLPPPLMVKGEYGTGKSWVLFEVEKHLRELRDTTHIHPIYIHYQLSPKGMVGTIMEKISQIESKTLYQKNAKIKEESTNKYVLLWDRFDHTYQPGKSDKTTLPKRAFGAGSAIMQKVQHSSELRSFLIENSAKVTLVGTAQSIEFMTNEDLPFFKFFNVVEIPTLGHDESREYILNRIKHNASAVELLSIIEKHKVYEGIDICEGRISNLNLFMDTLLEEYNDEVSVGELTKRFYFSFFSKTDPYIMMLINELSEAERLFLSLLLQNYKNYKRLNLSQHPEINVTKITKSLLEKDILEKKSGPRKGFFLKSKVLLNWFKFYQDPHGLDKKS